MAKSQIQLSETQCRNVVKVQIAQISSRFNPKTIKDGDKLKDVDIDSNDILKTLKRRITAAVVITALMDKNKFLTALRFKSDDSVLEAGRQTFFAQTAALKTD